MARRSGMAAKVTYNAATLAGIGQWTMDGLTRETIEDTSFGDTVKTYVFGFMDGGTLTFSGGYDPDDSTQGLLDSACVNASLIGGGTSGLRLYIDNTSYFTPGTSSRLLVTKCRNVDMEKSGLGKISFSAKVSGGPMVLV